MIESWAFDDGASPVSPAAALERLHDRIAAGHLETWLTSSSGRLLAVVTNRKRAMLMLLDDEDDPGQHAVTPQAVGQGGGFILANGQHDEYPDADTAPLTQALEIVSHILATGAPPADTVWSIDR